MSLFLLFSLLVKAQSPQKNYTISGFVKEQNSGELLIGVNIFVSGTQVGTTSNAYGFYSLTLPTDTYNIVYSFVGFGRDLRKIVLDKDLKLNVELANSVELTGVEIIGDKDKKISDDVSMSVISIPISQIKEIPALLGEKDVFKVLQLMPGVRSGSEASSGLYVRGGGPDQNLIILDDAPVYNASHLFGFFSIFNGDAIKSIELSKGGFPARYGGRLSSVVDVSMKDGNKSKFGGEAGIGLISSRIVLEGPIVKNKASFLVSARRTYLDVLTQPFVMAYNQGQTTGYYFYDLNAKVNYDFGDKDKLYISTYFGRDKVYINYKDGLSTSKNGLYWQNLTSTARWNHIFNNKIFSNASFIYSKYLFNVYSKQSYTTDFYELNYFSGIEDFSGKYDLYWIPNPNHYIRSGAQITAHKFTPGAFVLKNQSDQQMENNVAKLHSVESALYLEDEFRIKARTKVNAGIRLSQFGFKAKNYFKFEPRILASFMIAEDFSVKASYAVMNQYIHLLSNTGISLPIDLWVPATDDVGPQRSQQVAIGLAKDIKKPNLSISLELYYKDMSDIISYKEGASFLMIENFDASTEFNYEESVTSGNGTSKGIELLIQKKYGKFTGWVGYTLSYTKYQFDELNNGKSFFPRHDRRHDASVVGIYHINDDVTISATWVYGTGDAVSLPQSTFLSYPHGDNFRDLLLGGNLYGNQTANYGEKNSFRYAPYHRLDFGVQFKKKLKHFDRIIELSIYNVYNRKNPFMYFIGSDATYTYNVLKQISLFPFIPSFSYNIKF